MNTETLLDTEDASSKSSIIQTDSVQTDDKRFRSEEETSFDVSSAIRFYSRPRKNSTKMPTIKEVDKSGFNSLDYESWYGRIDSLDSEHVIARLSSRLPNYCPRIVKIERDFFVSKGITGKLTKGDEFEFTLKRIQWPKGQIEQKTTLRMIERVVLSKEEVEAAYEKDLKELSFLFRENE